MVKAHVPRRRNLLLLLIFALTAPAWGAVQNQGKEFAGKVRLVLPRFVYAVPGVETNIYFDNVILAANSRNYIFDVHCRKGTLLAERWTYTPRAGDAGDYPLTLEVRDGNNALLARETTTLRVAPADSGAGKRVTLLVVGDSLTQASVYTQHLLDLCDRPGGPVLQLIGSRGPDNRPARGRNRHEGYNGWTAQAFATLTGPLSRTGRFVPGKTGSPFVYGKSHGKPRLDFGAYCRQFNGGRPPDFVTFALGTNDIFYGTDADIDRIIDSIFTYMDSLVKMVRAFAPRTRIGIFLVIPPSHSQDGFQNYKGGERQTRWQYRRDQHRFVERLIQHFGGREAEGLYLVPTSLNLDCAQSFNRRYFARNAENPKKVLRVVDGIHPSPEGYRQMGDTLYCWIKACLAEKGK